MQEVECLHADGKYYREFAYDYFDFPYHELIPSLKGGYNVSFMTFDIETTNVHEDDQKYAFMYHWQACIDDKVVFGRTWQQFIAFMYQVEKNLQLSEKHKLVVYVHNLSFEFHFLYDFILFDNVFATEAHKVLKCSNELFEFRCSYMLSNMSLKKFIENSEGCIHVKGEGDLDYKTKRTPITELTLREKGYCFNDVKGLHEAIEYMLRFDTLRTIPITSTGYVRRDCRKAMRKNKKNRENFLNWQIDADLYLLIKEIFRGGNTASSRYLADQILENVESWDIHSAYPFVMAAMKYPTKFIKYSIVSLEELEQLIKEGKAVIGRFRFENISIKPNTPIAYIPFSKCIKCDPDAIIYNGRIIKAKYVEISLTEVDYNIIKGEYDFTDIFIKDSYTSVKRYLPDELLEVMFDYFEKKSKLKNDPSMYYEYVKAKNKLNAIYGMIATDIIRDEVEFKNGEFKIYTTLEPNIQEALNKYYNSRNSFLTYQWGMYVTAYTRMILEEGFKISGIDGVYGDTDSCKYIGDHRAEFEALNQRIRDFCERNGRKYYIDVDGERFELGTFENDACYDRFITLGAKKYAFEKEGKLGITVAGLSKKEGAKELAKKGGLEYFKNGEVFQNSGRTTATYNNEPIHFIRYRGERILTASNVAIFDTTYELGITDTMMQVLAMFSLDKEKNYN